MSKIFFKKILLFIIKKKYYYILAIIYRFFIVERLSNGKSKLIHSNVNNCTTILALDSDRYRGDLEALASSPLLRVLCIRSKWQGLLIGLLYEKDKINALDYSRAMPGDNLFDNIKEPAQEFMCEFLTVLFSMVKVSCVTTVSYRYIEDSDWALASEKLGIPYIMLYRECLLSKGLRFYHDVVQRHKKFKFFGSHIIVHNDTCKESFVESSFLDEKKISVVGALRMDKYLTTIKGNNQSRRTDNTRRQFVLFYFPYNMSLFGKQGTPPLNYKYKYAFSIWPYRKEYFRDVHSAIVELSIEYPEIDFIIKPKNIMIEDVSWKFYEKILDEMNFNKDKASNYFVESNANVHDLIFDSDAVCALQTSTAIEASIAGKPVILPIFENYRSTKNYQDFLWRQYLELFDVADNKRHFKDLIIRSMSCSVVNEKTLSKRKKIFKKFFNDLDGTSLNRYVEIIINIANTKSSTVK
ncbi:hypothetical protein HOL24_02775 [bacterium]|nr:hypothetical protein [bacterium]